jgi:methionyl aminopeptidase
MSITIKSKDEIRLMRGAGKLAAELLDFLTPFVQIGVSTEELNDRAQEFIDNH